MTDTPDLIAVCEECKLWEARYDFQRFRADGREHERDQAREQLARTCESLQAMIELAEAWVDTRRCSTAELRILNAARAMIAGDILACEQALVERLRTAADDDPEAFGWRELLIEAADELTRLRAAPTSAEVQREIKHLNDWADSDEWDHHSAPSLRGTATLLESLARRIAELERQLAEETAIVDRIWKQLGSPTYAELAGRSIYDLIDEAQESARQNAEDAERYRWLRDVGDGLWLAFKDRPDYSSAACDANIDAARAGSEHG